MNQIDQTEQRLMAALSRIAAAAERLGAQPVEMPPPPDPDSAAAAEIARLGRLLNAAEAEIADLTERLQVARERQAATVATLEARIASLTAQTDGQGVESQRLRMVNAQLRDALRGLREALSDGVAEAGQINRAMQAELDALHAARQLEAAEVDAVLAALEPLVGAAEAQAAAAIQEDSNAGA